MRSLLALISLGACLVAGGQNAGLADTGVAGIFQGSPAGLSAEAERLLDPPVLANRQYYGASLVSLGDIDHDSLVDFSVGMPEHPEGGYLHRIPDRRSRVYLLIG